MALPLSPPLLPQLARPAKKLPTGAGWVYEPKWDGFRTLAFVDGGDVYLQSRNGKPMRRYFPELTFPEGRYVLDGEIVLFDAQGRQDFDALGQRIHPAESRIRMLAEETPTRFVAFDLLALDDEVLLELSQRERRDRLEVVMGWRPGKEENTVGSLILGLHGDDGRLRPVGHTSGLSAKRKRELVAELKPYETGKRGMGDPSRWANDRELEWIELRPELVVEVTFDHVSDGRIRHGAKIQRWREDKDPAECRIDQLDQ